MNEILGNIGKLLKLLPSLLENRKIYFQIPLEK